MGYKSSTVFVTTSQVLSRDGSVQSEFLAEGHLDGQLFVRYDRETHRARPQGQWAEAVLGDQETEDLTENAQDLRRTLAHIEGQKGGLHSLQKIEICEIYEDGSTGCSWHWYYDGEFFLSLNLETQKWTVAQSSRAQTLAMNFWKEDTMKTKTHYQRCAGRLPVETTAISEIRGGRQEEQCPP
ncbi:hypothetical protein H8959_010886 [Pygathrix nigripes]